MLESLIATYGYWAILIGTFFEGETILVIGGFLAHRGYLHLPWVLAAAFIGTLSGDQLLFYLGRTRGRVVLARYPSWEPRVSKGRQLLERFRTPLILAFRFMYGFRTVLPFAIGMSTVKTRIFVVLNIISAVAWAVAIGTGGYLFGDAMEMIIGNIKRYELHVLAAIAFIGGMVWAVRLLRHKRTHRHTGT